jgi:hypothetical protein
MSLEQAFIDACKYVRRELPFGARNIVNRHPRAKQSVEHSRAYLQNNANTFAERVNVAKRFGAGNCQEMAYLAYDYLRTTRPNDGVRLLIVNQHMTVCAPLNREVSDVGFATND